MVIRCEDKVVLDINELPTFNSIKIYGELYISQDLMVSVLKAESVEIGRYGGLYVGNKLQYHSQLFTLNANRIVNFGVLSMFGSKSIHRYKIIEQFQKDQMTSLRLNTV